MSNFFISVNFKNNQITIEKLKETYKKTAGSKYIIVDNSCDKKASLELLSSLSEISSAAIFDPVHNSKDFFVINNIALIITDINNGFAHANNLALSFLLANGNSSDKIIILNNDACINCGYEEIERFNLDNVIVGALLVKENGCVQTLGGTDQLTKYNYGKNIAEGINPKKVDSNSFEVKGYINGAFMLMTFNTLKNIGLLDESYFMWCEEVAWCISAKKKGVSLICNPKIIVEHAIGASSNKDSISTLFGRTSTRNSLDRFIIRGYYHFRNSFLIVRTFYPESLFFFSFVMMGRLIKRIVGVWLYDSDKLKRTKILLKGYIDGVKGIKGKSI